MKSQWVVVSIPQCPFLREVLGALRRMWSCRSKFFDNKLCWTSSRQWDLSWKFRMEIFSSCQLGISIKHHQTQSSWEKWSDLPSGHETWLENPPFLIVDFPSELNLHLVRGLLPCLSTRGYSKVQNGKPSAWLGNGRIRIVFSGIWVIFAGSLKQINSKSKWWIPKPKTHYHLLMAIKPTAPARLRLGRGDGGMKARSF